MKNIDRLFLFLLLVVPLLSAIIIGALLTLREDVTPEESAAQPVVTVSPTFEIQPIQPSVQPTQETETTSKAKFEIQPITVTPSPTTVPEVSPTYSLPSKDEEESDLNTTNIVAGNSNDNKLNELPVTEGNNPGHTIEPSPPAEAPASSEEIEGEAQTGSLDLPNIVIYSTMIALFTGGFILLGSLLRKRQKG